MRRSISAWLAMVTVAMSTATLIQDGPIERDQSLAPVVDAIAVEVQALAQAPAPQGGVRHQLELLGSPAKLASLKSLTFMLATYGRTVPVRSVRLELGPQGCTLVAKGVTALTDLGYIQLAPVQPLPSGCSVTTALQTILLIIESSGSEPLALVAKTYQHPQRIDTLLSLSEEIRWHVAYPLGFFQDGQRQSLQGVPRFVLLAHLWGLTPKWAPALLAGLVALLCLGLVAGWLWRRAQKSGSRLRQVLALFWLTLAIFELHAFVAPPLQAPDELLHLLGYLKHHPKQLPEGALTGLAAAGHYPRLLCNRDEHFTAQDLREPSADPLPRRTVAGDMAQRSPLTLDLWRLFATLLPNDGAQGGHAGGLIASMRSLNGVFAAAVIAAAALGAGAGDVWLLSWLAMLLIPTLGFFTVHVSNYATVIPGYLVIVASLMELMVGRARRRTLVVFGLGVGLAVLSGRVGPLTMPIWLAMAVAAVAISVSRGSLLARDARFGWFAAILALALPLLIYRDSDFLATRPSPLPALRDLMLLLALGALAVGQLVIAVSAWLRQRRAKKNPTQLSLGDRLRPALALATIAFLSLLLVPVIFGVQTVPDLERGEGVHDLLRHSWTVVASFWSNQGLGGARDFLIVNSFWGGFGCPEQVLPREPIQFAGILALSGAGLLLGRALLLGTGLDMLAALVLLLGVTATVATLGAAAAMGQHGMSLHGRHLSGAYLLYVAIAAAGYRSWRAPWTPSVSPAADRSMAAPPWLPDAVVLVHALAMIFILRRYF